MRVTRELVEKFTIYNYGVTIYLIYFPQAKNSREAIHVVAARQAGDQSASRTVAEVNAMKAMTMLIVKPNTGMIKPTDAPLANSTDTTA